MIADVRTRAGLGQPPDKFYTNDSENSNRHLRHKTGDKELRETAFSQAVKELIEDEQETEVVLAMFGGSQLYQLKEPFKNLEIPRDTWFSMNEEQRMKKVTNIYAADIEDLYSISDNQGATPTCFVKCDKGSGGPNSVPNELSVTATAMKDSLDLHIAEQMWKKAEGLLSLPDAILPAPSTDKSSKSFSVLSQSGDSPNFVKVYNNAKVSCNCRNYKPEKICSHAISVAESLGILSEFVAWYRKQKVPTNWTSVATLDTNVKVSGRKQGTAKRQRKTKDAVLHYETSLLKSTVHSTSASSPHALPSTFSCDSSPVPVPADQPLSSVPIPSGHPLPPVSVPSGHPLPPVPVPSGHPLPPVPVPSGHPLPPVPVPSGHPLPPVPLPSGHPLSPVPVPLGHSLLPVSVPPSHPLPPVHVPPGQPLPSVPDAHLHFAVPPGQALPPKPTIPNTQSPYFLTKLN